MKLVLSLALLASAAAVGAQTTPSKPAAATAAPTPTPTRFPGVSDAGNAVLAKAQTTPDPQLQAIGRQNKAAHDQLMSAVMAPVIDIDKVAAALHAQEDAQSQLRTHSIDRIIAALKSLPADDRGTFLRTLLMAKQRPAGTPAAAPQP
jgi:uncharacterized membrane protein